MTAYPMNITVGAWTIPALITAGLLVAMFRPYRSSGDYDFGPIFRLFWLIPISLTWAIYFGIMLWLK